MSDNEVENPRHYQGLRDTLGIDVLDLIDATGFGYKLGNVLKYILRHEYKGHPLQDLRKAAFYLNRVIEELEAEEYDAGECENNIRDRIAGSCPTAQKIKDQYYGVFNVGDQVVCDDRWEGVVVRARVANYDKYDEHYVEVEWTHHPDGTPVTSHLRTEVQAERLEVLRP